MSDDELKSFIRMLEYLDDIDAMLTNFKSRGKGALKHVQQRIREQGNDVPSWKIVAKDMKRLIKAEGSATRAVKSIVNIAKDKKAAAKLSLADAREKAMKQLPKLQEVDTIVFKIHVDMAKVYKEIGMTTTGTNSYLKSLIKTYFPNYHRYFSEFKIAIKTLQ